MRTYLHRAPSIPGYGSSGIENAGRIARRNTSTRGGHLVVLAPAHQMLFTAFDSAIGHFRRYNREALLALTPNGLIPQKAVYLDSVGLLASLGNRFVLRSATPKASQIRLWDNFMVPLSRFIDPLTGYGFGKSVVTVWRREFKTNA